jgi:hypothetical protein
MNEPTAEREEFEKWAFEDSELEEGCERDESGCYLDDQMELAWRAWQAAWRAGAEDMREQNRILRKLLGDAVERLCETPPGHPMHDSQCTHKDMWEAIRALPVEREEPTR